MFQLVMKEVFDMIPSTNDQEFQMTMSKMSQHPQFAQMLMAAQQGKLPDEEAIAKAKAAPKLAKAKTLKAFETSK